MVRTVKNYQQQEEDYEDDDGDYISTTTASHNKDGKASSHRSKHSETEQRRRSKINERFQHLRDLIPQNDQKTDRASFLLEVIQYIHFLQEKLQVYEGTCQGWSPEITKLLRGNYGADNYPDQLQPARNGSVYENQITYEAEPSHNPQGSFPDVELLASQSRPPTWNAGQSCTPSELEESSISNAYSKGMLNNITQALGSSGVDLSQTSISVQFDIKKGTSSGATSTPLRFKDHNLSSSGNQTIRHCAVRSRDDVSDQVHKKPRTKQNQKKQQG
nr:hypothetical protein [Tanacetum cinerariifolium]